MDTFVNNFKIIIVLLGCILGSIIGEVDSLIYALVAFMAIDYLTGLLLAIYEKRVSSNIGFKGISKKVLIFALVALGNIIDQYIIGSGSFLRTMLIMFYLSNEGISILENAARMEIPFPQKLKDILLKIDGTDKK
ncbi:phage holin family protein [Desulfoscipio sp. XC116]|uniref:phage holin family protein n=1 Tax=Desulfoscipio sp. XC116 TaxID=3144975 RepID=UPI00325ABD59